MIAYLIAFVVGYSHPGIVVGVYDTERACKAAADALDNSTQVRLRLVCEVRT